jgi:hypothetical protein
MDYDHNGEPFTKGYDWKSYSLCRYEEYDGDSYSLDFLKYADDRGEYDPGDNKRVLDPEDDAASALLGGDWRMPSWAEMNELKNYCTWEWTVQDGVNGYRVTSPTNGNSIFLPAADARYGANLDDLGIYGYYWTASRWPTESYAVGMSFDAEKVSVGGFARYYGFSIRPVQGTVPIPVENVSLNIYEESILIGESITLEATVLPANATFPDLSWTYSIGWYAGGGTGNTVSLERREWRCRDGSGCRFRYHPGDEPGWWKDGRLRVDHHRSGGFPVGLIRLRAVLAFSGFYSYLCSPFWALVVPGRT